MKTFPSFYFIIFFLFSSLISNAQFPPAVGQPGTTAMYMDSTAFISWATTCQVTRGFVNIEDTTILYNGKNRASYGTEADALGLADNAVVSLGDGGSATLTFANPITNGTGFDFAVFENSIDGSFLELAFVEVSSDGINFFRFPAISYTQTSAQTGTFGSTDPTKINNFAGKYKVLYGTPFDLDTLKGIPGLDINKVTYVRLVDVVGDIHSPYASYDCLGNIVNDPWPTSFNTCGFDLDAVGVINEVLESVNEHGDHQPVQLFPNPVGKSFTIRSSPGTPAASFILTGITGDEIISVENITGKSTIECSFLSPGIYIGIFRFPDGTTESRKSSSFNTV